MEFYILQTGSEVNPTYYPMCTALSLGVKWKGCEADHSPPTSAEVKKTWSCIFTLPHIFMA
jgi:hypothetical protein